MARLHLAFGVIGGIGVVTVVLIAVVQPRLGRSGLLVLDRAILAAAAAVLAATVTGLAIALLDRGPADPLHLVYGFLALIAVPVSRLARIGDDEGRVRRSVLIGALVALGAVVRLFMTGG